MLFVGVFHPDDNYQTEAHAIHSHLPRSATVAKLLNDVNAIL